MSTRIRLSINGIRKTMPASAVWSYRPNRITRPFSYCLMTRTLKASAVMAIRNIKAKTIIVNMSLLLLTQLTHDNRYTFDGFNRYRVTLVKDFIGRRAPPLVIYAHDSSRIGVYVSFDGGSRTHQLIDIGFLRDRGNFLADTLATDGDVDHAQANREQ